MDSTRAVGEAIAQAAHPPRAWLQAGTATIYAHRFDAPNDEATGLIGGSEPDVPDTWRFSIEVATAWERAMDECDLPRTRKVVLRSAMVMSPDRGGVFDTLLRLVRFGLGGRAGDGRQYVSWIHDADFVRAVFWLIDHQEMAGPVNLAAPGPLPYSAFLRTATGVGHADRAPHDALDAGNRHAAPGDRERAGLEEPPSRAGPVGPGGLRVPLPRLAGSGSRHLPPLAYVKRG